MRTLTPSTTLLAALQAVGCISSYHYPDSPASIGEGAVSPDAALGVKVDAPRLAKRPFLDGLRGYGAEPVEMDAPPAAGRFVRVTVREVPSTPATKLWEATSAATWFILPLYSDSSGYDVAFDTFIDGRATHHYEYETRVAGWAWIGLAPLAWVDLLTPSRGDAFAGITRRFLIDCLDDGF
jgi:hypothetical protein